MDHDRPAIPYIYFPPVPGIELTSDDVADGAQVPQTCQADIMGMAGDNQSPQLRWSGAPAETQSFAVTCFDPDAPTGSGFWHWVVFDIPRRRQRAGAGSRYERRRRVAARRDPGPERRRRARLHRVRAAEGHGEHRYVFAVHALGVPKLGVDSSAPPALVGFNLTFNTLARGVLIAKYER